MINPSIVMLLLEKPEQEAASILNKFNCKWRVSHRDGENVNTISADRDDNRYNLIIQSGIIQRVLPG